MKKQKFFPLLLAAMMAMWSGSLMAQWSEAGLIVHPAGWPPCDVVATNVIDAAYCGSGVVAEFDMSGGYNGDVSSGGVKSISMNGVLYVDNANVAVEHDPTSNRYQTTLGWTVKKFVSGSQVAAFSLSAQANQLAHDPVHGVVAAAGSGVVTVLSEVNLAEEVTFSVGGADGVAYGPGGTMYVSTGSAVSIYTPTTAGGSLNYVISGSFNLAGSPTGVLNGASNLDMGSNGYLYIVEVPNRIRIVSPAPLPVELVDFEVRRDGIIHQLSWLTASEINFAGFEIQHSLDGKTFNEVIAFVEAKGGGFYEYQVDNRYAQNHYYRLRMIDVDGTYKDSPIRHASGNPAMAEAKVYPNPSPAGSQVTITADANISHLCGMKVTQVKANEQVSLPQGTYFVHYTSRQKGPDKLVVF